MKFKDAPIGTRFKYESDKIYVKLQEDGLICEWKGNVENVFQKFLSFAEKEEYLEKEIEPQ